jgi:diguanylate cyclase (GGDEF)-like protein
MEDLAAKIASLELELDQGRTQQEVLGNLLDRTNNQVYTFYHIAKTIASTHDFQEMIDQILAVIRKSLAIDRASLYLFDDAGDRLELRYSTGLTAQQPLSIAVGEGLPGRIAEVGEHSHIHDLSLFYDTFSDFVHLPGEETRDGAYIGIALKSRNRTIGVIGIDTRAKYGLTVEDMDFMSLVAHQISAGIEKSLLFTRTEQLSQIDGLTGLYNRRIFNEKLLQEVARRNRNGKPLALIMLDIDHFKIFNDSFGHQEGDTVLKELALVIRGQCRYTSTDICCRYGGEEFAVILTECDLPGALRVAERMRSAVEGNVFSVKQRHPGTRVTISLGVTCVDGSAVLAPEDVVANADKALYASKRDGRNRVSYEEAAAS